MRWIHCLFLFSFSCCMMVVWISLFIRGSFEVSHHWFQMFRPILCRSYPTLIWPLSLEETCLGMWLLGLGGAWRGTPPSLILSLICPSIAERALDSGHPKLWHCCSVHPIWKVCHPMWSLSLNSLPALLGNLAESRWHKEEGCSLITQLNNTLLHPSTNFGMSWHP